MEENGRFLRCATKTRNVGKDGMIGGANGRWVVGIAVLENETRSSSTDIVWGTPYWNWIISLLLAVSLPSTRKIATTAFLTSIDFEGGHSLSVQLLYTENFANRLWRRATKREPLYST
jgi:hypothetical protein